MASLVRRIQRRWSRGGADYEPNPQLTILSPDGGYRTLHPTKGWRTVSAKRVKLYK